MLEQMRSDVQENRKGDQLKGESEEDDDYEDDIGSPADQSMEMLKEDTIKTDKINEIMEEEDKLREQEKFILQQDEFQVKDLDDVDIIDDIDRSR